MVKSRIMVGLILFILVIVIMLAPPWCFNIVATFLAIIGMKELIDALKKSKYKTVNWVLYLSTVYLLIATTLINVFDYQLLMIFLIGLFFLLLFFIVFSDNKISIFDISINYMLILYIVGTISFLVFTRHLGDNGHFLVWLIFISAWCTDSGAYMIGMLFGKNKLPLKLSPNKSIEGVLGGIIMCIICCVIYGYILRYFSVLNIPIYYYIIFGFFISIIAQVGDLVASAIKRTIGIKDFSNMMPGHGGIVDRFDSVIFVAPFTYLFLYIFCNVV